MPAVSNYPDDEDDRRSTSTVASTVGTGLFSLASRMSNLNLEFADKLLEGEGGPGEHTIEEEEEEDGDDCRSEARTVYTAATELDREERDSIVDDLVTRRFGADLGGAESPDLSFTNRSPFQVGQGPSRMNAWLLDIHTVFFIECRFAHAFLPRGATSSSKDSPLDRYARFESVLTLSIPPYTAESLSKPVKQAQGFITHSSSYHHASLIQVEELRQHGYVIVDNFIPPELADQVRTATLQQHSRGRMADAPWTAAGDARSRGGVGGFDFVMPLTTGKPPADCSPMATLLVALSELYDDLSEFVRLRRTVGEQKGPSKHPLIPPLLALLKRLASSVPQESTRWPCTRAGALVSRATGTRSLTVVGSMGAGACLAWSAAAAVAVAEAGRCSPVFQVAGPLEAGLLQASWPKSRMTVPCRSGRQGGCLGRCWTGAMYCINLAPQQGGWGSWVGCRCPAPRACSCHCGAAWRAARGGLPLRRAIRVPYDRITSAAVERYSGEQRAAQEATVEAEEAGEEAAFRAQCGRRLPAP